MPVGIDDKSPRIDPNALADEALPLFGPEFLLHSPADSTFGRHDPVPGEVRRLDFIEPGQDEGDLTRVHPEVPGDGSVGGEPSRGNTSDESDDLGAEEGETGGFALAHGGFGRARLLPCELREVNLRHPEETRARTGESFRNHERWSGFQQWQAR